MNRPTVIPRSEWPTVLQPFAHQLKGLAVGGCVDPARETRMEGGTLAHCHVSRKGRVDFDGWICVKSARVLGFRLLLLHEVGHLLTRRGHDDRWRKKVRAIGGRLGPVNYAGMELLDYRKGRKLPR